MKFRTEVALPPCPAPLYPQSRVVFLGSCFADHIGRRMGGCLPAAQLCVNPHGALYNPVSILCAIGGLLHPEAGTTDEGLFRAADGLWHHWQYGTRFTADTASALAEQLRAHRAAASALLKLADALYITLSTDHAYYLKGGEAAGRPVANCHKQPAALFEERVADLQELTREWDTLLKELAEQRPALRIVFTLSPYRYAKYGMHENALSKARLLLLIDGLCRRHANATYFPAYEIVTDELRDYRFYEADMLHPSAQAVDYVWERFREWAFTPELTAYADERARLVRDLAHRPLHPDSEAHRRFRAALAQRLAAFEQKWGERPEQPAHSPEGATLAGVPPVPADGQLL